MDPSAIDLDHLRQWVGRTRVDRDVASLRHARLMAATVDHPRALAEGDPLPPLWHWIYCLEGLPPSQLGPDGHPARGGFLPPVPLPNRMWAGGRVQVDAPLPIGAPIEKRSQVLAVTHKQGRAGDLVFVTVEHAVFAAGARCLREEHDIVYRRRSPSAVPSAPAARAADAPEPSAPAHQRHWRPDTTQLFRYSALTFNGHRIHYDADYCRQVEGYANLVVHGPLIATLLAGLAQDAAHEAAGGAALRFFEYRALRPVLLGEALSLQVEAGAAGVTDRRLRARVGTQGDAMQALARWG